MYIINNPLCQEVSIHVYEKRGAERVGRGRRKEGIAELLKTGVTKLQHYSNPWLLDIVHGAVENSDCVVFVSEQVLGTLSTVLSSQQPRDQHGKTVWLVILDINNSSLVLQ